MPASPPRPDDDDSTDFSLRVPIDPGSDADLYGLPTEAKVPAACGHDPVERMATEFLDALRAGQQPDIEEYVKQLPQKEQEIRELFPLIASLEDWKHDREAEAMARDIPREFRIERLGDCRILREIGRGGMGVVFEAEQQPIGRRVAVKLLPRQIGGQTSRARFRSEAQTAAALKHPYIVPIYSFGEQDGMCFYVMQLIEGIGLNRVIELFRQGNGSLTAASIRQQFHESNSIDPAASMEVQKGRKTISTIDGPGTSARIIRSDAWMQIVRIALQVADAMRYAHQQGVLHRDIKPANLLLDPNGTVWIADFGLARPLEEGFSHSPRVAGTLRYMAPEQFSGQCDVRSDLYSLGATLYELCTLRPLYETTDRRLLLAEIQTSTPPSPRSIRPSIPRGLEVIIQKAVSREPSRRYQTAAELIADLKAFARSPRRNPFTWLKDKLRRRSS
ncbi:MAG: serine/threonine-protein kinase [Planctomycetaceae bacterium]